MNVEIQDCYIKAVQTSGSVHHRLEESGSLVGLHGNFFVCKTEKQIFWHKKKLTQLQPHIVFLATVFLQIKKSEL